ncbi:MAG TPA: DUF3306 domain-containing protein [Casimicrobiaceae bacterium]|nr:DUF3306 domain-containing protein [Casimicrobiaceae bacterium]
MTLKRVEGKRFSLARWSRRKLESALQNGATAAESPASAPPVPAAVAPTALSPTAPSPELPAVESLTFDSDFTPFLRPGVDSDLKRAALKRLLRDPRFNVMDGLDVYIDDYTKADPIAPDMLSELIERFDFGDSAASKPVAAATDAPAEAPARREQAASAESAASATALPGTAGEASPSAPANAERTDDTIAMMGTDPEIKAGARTAG